MTVPVRESWNGTFSSSATNDFSVDVPTGITAGDLLIIITACDSLSSSAVMSITDIDWTKIDEFGDNGSSGVHIAAWWKEADGTETAESVISVSSYDYVGWYFRFSGADMTTPIYAYTGNQSTTSGTSFDMASLSTTGDVYGIAASGWDGGDCLPLTMTGNGWAELDELGQNFADRVGGNVGFNAAPGSLGANVTSDSSDGWAYIKLHIAPLVPAGPAIDNIDGISGDTIVSISGVTVGDIVSMSGVTF